MSHNYGKRVEVKSNRLKLHEYLRMTFDFTEKEKVKMKMDNYVERMINEFRMKISRIDTALTAAGNNLFLR